MATPISSTPTATSSFSKRERRQSMAERRPSTSYTPAVIPHLAGLETPQEMSPLKLEECDVVIIGTGLSQSILAAALAWQGTQVLHIDNNHYYGDSSSCLTIDQLKKWCVDVNQGKFNHFKDAQIYIPGGKRSNKYTSRDYGIDLTPKIMFCQSDLLSLLIQSRVYRYLEFQSLANFHVFENDDFKQKITNSTSKHDIFTDKTLSLITKRNLMKFLKFILIEEEHVRRALVKQYSNRPIHEFLTQEFKLEESQINELVYSIGLCNKQETTTKEAVIRIRRFLSSFDCYGKFPCMTSKFGGPGEISQGFCRSAAVAGTTYKLSTTMTDFDPVSKTAHFSDGSNIKVNEKIIISPTQIPKFLVPSYQKLTESLPSYYITRLITVVKRDCKEWMDPPQSASAAIVVFPPHSLPTDNESAVQVIIQNGDSGVCPEGQSIWYSHTCEQDLARAKRDLECAFEKMEMALLRGTPGTIPDVLDDIDLFSAGTTPMADSFKLGSSLANFMPKEKVEIVCKVGYVQQTYINPDLSNVFKANPNNSITCKKVPTGVDDEDMIIFGNMPSSELSYDGIITNVKQIYARVTGTDDDFFDVDFEDDDEEMQDHQQPQQPQVNQSGQVLGGIVGGGRMDEDAIDEDVIEDDSDDDHKPFGVDQMEL
ncbi:rab proteins geranylgeranyltransferase component A [Spathaspora passalidarum NRRL Y-27907]|uniref:Rab proteins geranylgeranyltransferase n=1 Tax=Spathaspora passalidarum (strain NRRL Y-27907 / 11-Y1) TaxID=619300 RepID=G3ARX2_SPAPN|nr:rab proteins geranylgeranyltransferase component A [Spathaspora passalidarum NRRL Y-27907]EGW31821.1 rab proteins geranylgeranyltransferase component A [Spathaspora passalidarum NRRL Y-27907]